MQEQQHVYNYNSDPEQQHQQQFIFPQPHQEHNHPTQQHPYHHFQSPQQQQQQHLPQQQQQPTIPCLIVPQCIERPSPSKIIRSGVNRFGRHDGLRRSFGEKNNNHLASSSIKRANSTTPTNKNSIRDNVKNPRLVFPPSFDNNIDAAASNNRKKLIFSSDNPRPQPRY